MKLIASVFGLPLAVAIMLAGAAGAQEMGGPHIPLPLPSIYMPNPSPSTLGGVESIACAGSHWVSTISTLGVPSCTQPSFADISGTANAAQLPTPTTGALGGIKSIAGVSHKWVSSIDNTGQPFLLQPIIGDLTSLGANNIPGDLGSGFVALAMPPCTGALTWAAGVGFGCNTSAGTGTVTEQKDLSAGGETQSGNCDNTNSNASNPCVHYAPGGFLNVLRNNSLTAYFHGCSILSGACTITTAGGWCAEGVFVIPTGASVTCQQVAAPVLGAPYHSMKITGAAGVTDVQVRFVVDSLQHNLFAGRVVTFQMQWVNGTGGTVTTTLAGKYANGGQDNWTPTAIDLAATNLQACTSTSDCIEAYSFTTTSGANNGYEFVADLGNNFSATGKTATIIDFDARVTPGVATGLNANPPPFEMRDPASDIAWNQRFFRATYDNGVAPGTATHVGIVGMTGGTSSNSGSAANVFGNPMDCDPNVSIWDGAGNANKVSFWNAAAWVDNQGAPAVVSPGNNGFQLYDNVAGTNLSFHYTADCTIPGG